MDPEPKPLAELVEKFRREFESMSREMNRSFARLEAKLDAMNAKLDVDLRACDRMSKGWKR